MLVMKVANCASHGHILGHAPPAHASPHADCLRASHCAGLRAARTEPRRGACAGTNCAVGAAQRRIAHHRLADGTHLGCRDAGTGRRGAGLFRRRPPWGSYGMLARASISAPNLSVALKRWCRHHALLADDITLKLTAEGDTALLSITEQRDLGALREFCL